MGGARRDRRAWYLLLLLPLAGTLVPPLYNVEDPTLAGIPFFYWYQLLWVPLSVLATWAVYRRTRREP
jgi:hypothetical protein